MTTKISQPVLGRLVFGIAASIAVLLIFVDRFPQPSGIDVGGPDIILMLSIFVAGIGGVVLGDGVSKLSPSFRRRIVRIFVQIVGVGAVLTPALVYGQFVSPRYFSVDVIRFWYSATLVFGTILVGIQHGYLLIRDRTKFISSEE